MPLLSSHEVQLYYEATGAGQPLLFIHGLGSSTRDWEPQVAEFSRSYRVITVDLRGHGQSDKPAGPYTIPMFAADVATLIQTLGAAPAHVVGLSLGGGVAFQLAVDYPALLKTLTIVNSGPSMGVTPEQAQAEIARRVGIVQEMGMRAMGQALAPNLFPSPEHEALRQTFIERWAANEPQPYIEATKSLLGFDVTGRLGEIQCPVLIVTAEHDYTPVAAKEAYVKLMSNAELVVIPGAHHATPMEQPQSFNAALKAFLAKTA
jgi:pimeloyl-ACP methyl ester carboxylesterase